MSKRAETKPAGSKKSSGLVKILRKVVPFLFHDAARPAAKKSAGPVAVKAVKRPVAAKKAKTKKTKAGSKKKSVPKTMRKAVAVLEAKKSVSKKPVPISAQTTLAFIDDETKEEIRNEVVEAEAKHIAEAAKVEVPAAAQPKVSHKLPRFLLGKDKKEIAAQDSRAVAEIDTENDEFLKKVELKDTSKGKTAKASPWAMLRGRFSFGRAPNTREKPSKDDEVLTKKEIAKDTFLQRVEKKSARSVVGTVLDEEQLALMKQESQPTEGLEDFASGTAKGKAAIVKAERAKGRILSSADLKREALEAKEATKRLEKEVREIKEEMRAQEPAEAAKTAAKPLPVPDELPARKKPVLHKPKNGLQKFLAALGHIGMGRERMHFVENLATMLNAGLPLVDSLRTLQLETRGKPMKKLLQRVMDAVENGSPLWRAMDAQSFFSLHAIALIRIGEEAGNLAENMEYLAEQEEKDHALKSKVKMAMIYPSIVMTLMFIIVVGLGMFVLPNLIGVLFSLNVELPLTTRLVIMFSNAFSQYGHIAVPSSIGGFFFIVILAKYTPMRVVFQWMMFKIPGIGRLAREATIARFGVILGGLLRAGVPVVEAMQSLVEVTPIVAYRNLYARMLDHITIGDSFSKSFAAIKGSQKLLPASVQQLVITGEKSGALSEIMLKIADIYDRKASETAQKLPIILEPMLLLFIGGLVGTIAFAIIVPIYSIVGNVGR